MWKWLDYELTTLAAFPALETTILQSWWFSKLRPWLCNDGLHSWCLDVFEFIAFPSWIVCRLWRALCRGWGCYQHLACLLGCYVLRFSFYCIIHNTTMMFITISLTTHVLCVLFPFLISIVAMHYCLSLLLIDNVAE